GWLMYDLTGSTVELGLVSGVRLLPALVLAPIAGVLADRGDRKFQLLVAQAINAVMNFILAALLLAGRIETWHIYATGFIVAIVQVFEIPARLSMMPESVDRTHLTNALGQGALAWNVSQTVGPAAAGGLIAAVGVGWAYVVQGLIYAFSTVWTHQLRIGGRVVRNESEPLSIVRGTIEGWRYILHHPVIRGGMAVLLLVACFGLSILTLLPAFARDVLQTGPTGQGLLVTVMGVGGMVASFLVAAVSDRFPKGKIMLAGGVAFGLAEVAFGLSSWFVLSLLCMAVIGVSSVLCTALVNTVLQRHSAPEMRGRVTSAFQQNQVAMTGGGIMIGTLAAAVGTPGAAIIMGFACTFGVIAIAIAMPAVRAIRQ
ncbi:MAG: hypothetical protein QOF51_2693, partial [Chloroflexota bacterium]|nr:hypothetical protein [Chloroflexota bacterium]